MKKWLYLLFVAISFPVLGQNKAMTIALQKATHDSIRCRILNDAFNATNNYEEKLQYNQQLEKIIEKNNSNSKQSASEEEAFLLYKFFYLNNYGYYYQNPELSKNDISIKYFQQSLSIGNKLIEIDVNSNKVALMLANTHFEIGKKFYEFSQINLATPHLFTALKSYEKLKDDKGIAKTNLNIGLLFAAQKDFKKAEYYYLKSIMLCKKSNDLNTLASAYLDLGTNLYDQKKYTESFIYLNKSIKTYEQTDNKLGLSYSLHNLAQKYNESGDPQKAMDYLKKSLVIREEIGDKRAIAESLCSIGICYRWLGDIPKAIEYLQKATKMASENSFTSVILNSSDMLNYIYEEDLKDYKNALINYRLYIQSKDSIQNEKTKLDLVKNHYQYEYDKKEAIIKEETEAKIFQTKAEKKQNQIIYSSIIVFLFTILSIIVIAFYFYRKKLKTEKLLKDKELALEIADNERRRISADLHDDLGAGISSIAILSNRIQFQESMDDVRVDASNIIENTKKVSQKLTEVIWELNSEHNNLEDLLLFIQKQGNDLFKETKTNFSMLIPIEIPDIYFSSYERKQIYLSVKECFHNIIKHAKASKVTCKTIINKELTITIKDNGVGFDVNEKLNNSTGEGLNNLKYRVANLQGKVVINSSQEGTWITLEIPLNKN
uniref:tetratricopeptide repeat-containing sensor histidine kinase n=1 Tax=Flavobacterium sp. TaxID=239 RepID=UPI004049E5BD